MIKTSGVHHQKKDIYIIIITLLNNIMNHFTQEYTDIYQYIYTITKEIIKEKQRISSKNKQTYLLLCYDT